MQDLLVGVIVLACTVYAMWALIPAVMRRSLAGRFARWPLPVPLVRRFQKVADAGSGCGCNGCDRGSAPAAKSPAQEQPVQFHPRRTRS
jgi:hypothetical protein